MSDFSTHDTILPLFSPMVQGPRKRYRTLVADPPWRYNDKLGDGPRGAAAHYGTMSASEIANLPVTLWAEDNAHLYLWTTNAFIVEAHQIAKAWGFTVRTILTWIKGKGDVERASFVKHIGLGHHFRNSTEHVLFAVRGSLDVKRHDIPTHFVAERKKHSEKPAAFYDIVGSMSHGPYLDVFARKQRFIGGHDFEVMDAFGNEVYNAPGLLETLTPEQADGLVGS